MMMARHYLDWGCSLREAVIQGAVFRKIHSILSFRILLSTQPEPTPESAFQAVLRRLYAIQRRYRLPLHFLREPKRRACSIRLRLEVRNIILIFASKKWIMPSYLLLLRGCRASSLFPSPYTRRVFAQQEHSRDS